MHNIWIVNQFANTPDLPGHTRQFEIAKYLVKKGFEITVFSSDFNLSERRFLKLKKMQMSLFEKISNISFIWLRVFPYYSNNWRRLTNIISFAIHLLIRMFYESINLNHPKIIIASSPQLPAAFFAYFYAKLFKVPFIFEVRDLWPQILIDQGGKSKRNLFIRLLFIIERIIYKGSETVIVLSQGTVNYVKSKGAKKTIWLPNGPDLKLFKQIPLPEENEVFNEKRPFLIIYAGAHGEANGLFNIINTAKYLKDDPVKIILIGDGPEKKRLQSSAKGLKNIIFKDPIPQSLIPDFIAKSDAIIHSLKKIKLFEYGVSPNKLYDAYAIGRPVITSSPGIINREVENFKIGVTAPPENPKALADSIKRLFKMSRIERIGMANRARKLAEELYSREKINSSYEMLIKECFKPKK